MSRIITHVTTMDHLGRFLHKVKRPIATFFQVVKILVLVEVWSKYQSVHLMG